MHIIIKKKKKKKDIYRKQKIKADRIYLEHRGEPNWLKSHPICLAIPNSPVQY
tara:strand:- start:1866 stop:2024 length:159 start_codon:yes stop_codon:yes gene_type:complete